MKKYITDNTCNHIENGYSFSIGIPRIDNRVVSCVCASLMTTIFLTPSINKGFLWLKINRGFVILGLKIIVIHHRPVYNTIMFQERLSKRILHTCHQYNNLTLFILAQLVS